MPVYRPLIGFDKQEIVEISEKIDAYETSILPYEDCCTIFVAKHPVTKPNIGVIRKSEEKLSENIDELFQKAIEYAVKGGAVDFPGNEEIDYWETVCDEVRVCKGIRRMLDAGVNPKHITISSDGQGSLPIFNEKGEFLRMGMGQSSCLLKEVKECVEKAGIPLETAISTITANPAEILSLKGKGKIQEGFDADLCVLDQGLEIQEVVARGKTVYRK